MFIHFHTQIINTVKHHTVNKTMHLLTIVDYKFAVKECYLKWNN